MKTTKTNAMNECAKNARAEKVMNEGQMNVNQKPTAKSVHVPSNYQINKKIAVAELDNELRGFNANLKAVKTLLNAKNIHVLQLFNDDSMKIENFNFGYLHTNLPNKFDSKDRICNIKKLVDGMDVEGFDVIGGEVKKVLVPCNKWTANQFINLFKSAHRAERKRLSDAIRAKQRAEKERERAEKESRRNLLKEFEGLSLEDIQILKNLKNERESK